MYGMEGGEWDGVEVEVGGVGWDGGGGGGSCYIYPVARYFRAQSG